MFEEFDNYLSSSFSIDYWSDEGIGIAEEKLADFSNNDWDQLKLASASHESLWLIRCAEVLGDHEDILAVEVLMELAAHKDTDVQIAALDSMSSLLSSVKVTEDIFEKLKFIIGTIESSSIVVKTMLDSLRSKIA